MPWSNEYERHVSCWKHPMTRMFAYPRTQMTCSREVPGVLAPKTFVPRNRIPRNLAGARPPTFQQIFKLRTPTFTDTNLPTMVSKTYTRPDPTLSFTKECTENCQQRQPKRKIENSIGIWTRKCGCSFG
jgi:hypothetical protein